MTETGTIRTDGATLYYECRGSGPGLLMISGGGGDAAYHTAVAEYLADAYTVLTYDRRGNSRSTVDDPAAPLRIEQQSADALAVLAHHDLTSARVFGGSGGALIGLDLAVRHSAAVEALVAHEPPVHSLMSDTDRALFDEIDAIARSEGVWPAYVRFMATIDRPGNSKAVRSRLGRRVLGGLMHGGQRLAAHGPRGVRDVSRFIGNAGYLMTREMRPFMAFEPDFDALAASGIPIVVGVGERSRPYYPARAGEAVAARLDVPVVEFPGGHAGYAEGTAEFAATLRSTLAELGEPGRISR